MTVAELRKDKLGLSQEAFANLLGLASKSYVCELENTGRCSVRIALEIERLSEGQIPAETLNPDVKLVRDAGAGGA
jgi:DNA-binding transcriptional regulator YdaS (Cro superfamily)